MNCALTNVVTMAKVNLTTLIYLLSDPRLMLSKLVQRNHCNDMDTV